jgi:putative transposase
MRKVAILRAVTVIFIVRLLWNVAPPSVRFWWNQFGPMFAAEIRKRGVARMRAYPQWRWHLDEVFVKVNGKLCYLWRAVDHEGDAWRQWSRRSGTKSRR